MNAVEKQFIINESKQHTEYTREKCHERNMSVAIESSKSVCCDREVQKINKVYELWANDDDGNDGIELIFSIVRHRRCRFRQSNVASSYFYAQQILCSCHLSQWNTRGI